MRVLVKGVAAMGAAMMRVLGRDRALRSLLCCRALLLLLWAPVAAAVCPHCAGNFASCRFETDNVCPVVSVVADNAAVISAGVGVLTLATIVKPKFLRVFARVSLETLLTLVKRPTPGTPFKIEKDTKGSEILAAISYGQVTMENALFQLSDLMDSTDDETELLKIKGKVECLKVINPKVGDAMGACSAIDLGIYSYIWAKVSEHVMTRTQNEKVVIDARLAGEGGHATASTFVAKFVRPQSMEDFAEMINLYIMLCHGLAVASVMLLTDFFSFVVYDTIRLRGESWMLAHELLLVLFKKIEDSDQRLTLGNAYDEIYLNAVMDEARLNAAAFFRSSGGNPLAPHMENKEASGSSKVVYNGKYTASSTQPCPFFNSEDSKRAGHSAAHPARALLPDGTCKYNHICNKWVSDKGKKGRCLCTAGTAHHPRFKCDNPSRCSEPMA